MDLEEILKEEKTLRNCGSNADLIKKVGKNSALILEFLVKIKNLGSFDFKTLVEDYPKINRNENEVKKDFEKLVRTGWVRGYVSGTCYSFEATYKLRSYLFK